MTAVDEKTGSEILRSLDEGIGRLRADMRTADEAVQSSSVQLLKLGEAELSAYKRLAELRLEQLTRGGVITSLDATTQRVRDLLAQRDEKLAELARRMTEAQQQLTALEEQREQQRTHVESAAGRLDEQEAAVQARLQADADYGRQLEEARGAEATADEAERKTATAEQDRAEKGAPYEADPLFMYLWKRRYGTSEYSANPITRLVDRYVARRCNYAEARPNYWMLQEIPRRLREHAGRVRSAASEQFEKLQAIERQAAEHDGVPALEKALEKERSTLAELDESIEAGEKGLAAQHDARSAYASGEDSETLQALEALTAELRGEGLEALRQRAASTVDDEDDRLVARIYEYEHARGRLEDALQRSKTVQARHAARVRELADVRHRFKRHDYDDMHSVFTNAALLTLAISDFQRGLVSGDDLWSALRSYQRFRRRAAYPDFGSGGFPGRVGPWRVPRSLGRGWNFPGPPRGGGFGGGGFKTGGGFGGGGFKSGGGF